jgi:hypothetical protein
MGSIPTLVEAARLREVFATSPKVNAAEQALRAFCVEHPRDALRLLGMWAHTPPLSARECQAVLARFTPAPASRCARCGHTIEYIVDEPDPGWWRHIEHGAVHWPHSVVPHYEDTDRPGGAR